MATPLARMGDTLTSADAALPEGFTLTLEAIFATEYPRPLMLD